MRKALDEGKIVIAAGFQGIDKDFNITTLGRGGSDTTATALAAVLQADECEIYTDVEGVFTTDPRIVPESRKIERISYDEMLELASLGAGVMHSRSIEFAKKFRQPLRVRPSFNQNAGTLIAPEGGAEPRVVTGLALVRHEARVSLRDLPDRPGVMSVIFSKMAAHKIPIDMVVQNVAKGATADVSFTVPEGDLGETLTAAQEALDELGAGSVRTGANLSKVSAVGVGMRTHSGVAAQMFRALAERGINIEMITTSDIKISTLIQRGDAEAALAAVHQAFGLESPQPAAPRVGRLQQPAAGRNGGAADDILQQVVQKLSGMEDIVVSDVVLDASQSLITVAGLPDVPGVCAELFTAVAEGNIMVDTIVQNVSRDGHTVVSFTVPRNDHHACLLLVRELLTQWPGSACVSEPEVAQLAVMGVGLRTHTGVGERMFRALGEAGINVRMVNTSEIRVSATVAADQGSAALAALQAAFGRA